MDSLSFFDYQHYSTIGDACRSSGPASLPNNQTDGCGFINQDDHAVRDAVRDNVHRVPYSTLPSEEKAYFARVVECARRFHSSYAGLVNNRTFTFVQGNRTLDALVCDEKTPTPKQLRSVVNEHRNILFAGDSVIRQQFFVFLCMLDHE